LKVTFLGTGTSQGVPVIACACDVCTSLDFRDKRLRSSVHIEIDGKSLVIDTGPDFRHQMLREYITHLDAILFTHAHRDHTAGLDDVRAYNFLQGIDMPIYGEPMVIHQIKNDFAYIFGPDNYPGLPRLKPFPIDEHPFNVHGITIQPLPVMHLKLPVMGFRIGNFSYITDANAIPDQTFDLLKGTQVLVLNALQREKHISHFNLAEALEVAQRVGAPKTYFTHISHKLGRHAVVETELPDGVSLAYDGLKIRL
jgi:phosphoribosyl 1,2-cyclic phosphate phosphodiesterase